MPKAITRENFNKEIMENSNLSVVQFKTEWSGAHHIIEPIYVDLAKTYGHNVAFYTIDVDEQQGFQKEFGLIEIPTILFFRSGKVVDHAIGLTSRTELEAKIERAIRTGDNGL